MKLNSNKSKTLLISRSHIEVQPNHTFTLATLYPMSEPLTILGVTSHTFEKHLLNVSANATRKLGAVHKAPCIYNTNKISAPCFSHFLWSSEQQTENMCEQKFLKRKSQ